MAPFSDKAPSYEPKDATGRTARMDPGNSTHLHLPTMGFPASTYDAEADPLMESSLFAEWIDAWPVSSPPARCPRLV